MTESQKVRGKSADGQLRCLRCGGPLVRVRVDTWSPTNLLLKQLQRISDAAGLRFMHCQNCGKIEFYK